MEEKDFPNQRCLRSPARVTTQQKHPIQVFFFFFFGSFLSKINTDFFFLSFLQEIHSGGSNNVAKAKSGGLYVWGNDVCIGVIIIVDKFYFIVLRSIICIFRLFWKFFFELSFKYSHPSFIGNR